MRTEYRTGWFWTPIDPDRSMLVPASTQYPTPPIRWLHRIGCAVERGQECDSEKRDGPCQK